VACTSAAACTAVGIIFNSSSAPGTLVETSSGTTWSIKSSPDPSTGYNDLNGISCPSVSDCVAVGQYDDNGSGDDAALVQSWNGSSWSNAEEGVNPGGNGDELEGSSCISQTNCTAVGEYDSGSDMETLIETWNGSSWSSVPSPNPNPSSDSSVLYGVSCTSSTFCVAVGDYESSGVTDTLIETWNGTSWSMVSSPDDSSTVNSLEAVSCTSSTFCVAVGYEDYPTPEPTPLIDTWNGSSWSATSAPIPTSNKSYLYGVSCTSTTSCEAVGDYVYGTTPETLVEKWNGSSWSPPLSPNPSSTYNFLASVSCVSSTSCKAVGNYSNGSTEDTLVEIWNGSSWSTVSSADPGNSYNYLAGVSCTSSTACTAVGVSYDAGSTQDTLVETSSSAGTAPAITGFTPASGPVGTKVTITGSNLAGATSVTFNGTPAAISKDTANKITVKVPSGATTGKISVTTSAGTAKSASKFTVT
jgi:hypothetical protein